jgi:two-component system phosphate regulon sensor histidine kinase PhoR
MKKQQIRWIIALMAVATLGLTGFQGYWVYQARAVAEERFDQDVQEALQHVANKLQREEVAWLAAQQMKDTALLASTPPLQQPAADKDGIPGNPKNLAAQSRTPRKRTTRGANPVVPADSRPAGDDSLYAGGIIQFQIQQTYTEYTPVYGNDSSTVYSANLQNKPLLRRHDPFRDMSEYSRYTREWQEMQRQNEALERWLNEAMLEQMRLMGITIDSVSQEAPSTAHTAKKKNTKPKKNRPARSETQTNMSGTTQTSPPELVAQVDKVKQQSEIVKDVFQQLFSKERPVEKRIDPLKLDSLLKAEVRNQNIDIPFDYGVHSGEARQVFFASSPLGRMSIPDEAFTVNLFTNDLHAKNDILYVMFPDKEKFINGSTLWVMMASVLLCSVIMGIFYVSVNTILKQKKLSEIKNDFINNMTHEFKTPISTISLACEMLQDPDVQTHSKQLNRYLRVISDENRRLGSQVEKVLQAAVLDKGQLKLKLAEIDLHEVIDNVLQNIGVQIEKREGTIDLQLEAEHTQIEADEVHITNLVYNLLDNANKYSPEKPQITIRTQNVEGGVKVSIADKGIGMNKDALTKIFDKFYRVSTGNLHDVKGFGLGLSYVKTVVDTHHGQIEVESHPNVGSTFEVFLPFRQEA